MTSEIKKVHHNTISGTTMTTSEFFFFKALVKELRILSVWKKWLLLVVFFHALFVLFIGIDSSVIDKHAWRQSQTGITIFWLLQGGPWLAYETPVLGHPWSMPFEFPVYQLIVAALVKVTGLSIDICGRLVSFFFYLSVLPLIYRLTRHFQCDQFYFFIFSIFYLVSPFYLFWGRTLMIESTAVFFSLAWLTGLILYFSNNNVRTFIIVIIFGVLAALTKVTTFFVFAVAGGIYMLYWLFQQKKLLNISAIRPLLISLVMVSVPLLAIILYTDFADGLKQTHPLANHLTSKELRDWNYGTWQQRTDISNWGSIFLRMFKNLLGLGSVILFFSAFFIKWKKNEILIISSFLFVFLIAVMVFFNVHRFHGYYQYANYLFLLTIFAWITFKVFKKLSNRKTMLGLFAVCLLAIGQFYSFYFPKMNNNSFLAVTDFVRQQTRPGQAIIVLGYSWAPLVAFYSERKSLHVISGWVPKPISHLGGMPLGAVIVGGESKVNDVELNKFLSRFSNLKQINFSTSLGKTVVITGFQNKAGK